MGRSAFWRCPCLSVDDRRSVSSLAYLRCKLGGMSLDNEERRQSLAQFQTENWSELRHLLPQPVGTGMFRARIYTVDTLPGNVKVRDGADPH